MVADPAMRAVSAAFPALCAVSLGLPFGVGWATGVHWPVPTRLNDRRRDHGRARSLPVLQDSEALLPPAS